MGKRKRWPQELADRARAVGWDVRYTSRSHWRVTNPEGESVIIPGTPSSSRTKANTLAQLRRMGFEDAEQAMRDRAERDRQRRLQRGQRAPEIEPPTESDDETMSLKPENEGAELTETVTVGGVKLAVIETGPAMFQPPRGGQPRELPEGREIMLADESVYYQCRKVVADGRSPGKDQFCDRVFPRPNGLFTHQNRYHAEAPRPTPKPGPKPEVRDPGGVIPVETGPGGSTPTASAAPASGTSALPEPGLVARTVRIAEGLDALAAGLTDLSHTAHSISRELRQVLADLPQQVVDDETRRKVETFDRMTQLITNRNESNGDSNR